jgi:hypothetical protein
MARLLNNVEKYGGTGQAADDAIRITAHALCVLDN